MNGTPPGGKPPPNPDTVNDINNTSAAFGLAAEKAIGYRQEVDALTKAFQAFNEAIKDNRIGFKEAVNGLDTLQKASMEMRESYGDLSAYTKTMRDSIDVLNIAIRDNEANFKNLIQQKTELTKSLKEATERVGQYNEAIAAQTKVEENLNKSKENAVKIQQELAEAEKRLDGIRKLALPGTEDSLKVYQDIVDAKKQELESTNAIVSANQRLYTDATERVTALSDAQEKLNQEKEKERKLNEELTASAANQPLLKYEAKRKQALLDTGKEIASMTEKFLQLNSQSNIFGGILMSMSKDGKFGSSIGDLTLSIGKNLAESFLNPTNAANRFFNLLNERVVKSTLEFDKIGASVNKATGGFRGGFEAVALGTLNTSAIGGLAQFGVTMEKFAQTYGSLSKSIGNFNNMLGEQRKLLVDSAAAMQNLGVGAETYGKLASTYMGAIGKSAYGADQAVTQLARDALAVGKSVEEYTRDFETAMTRISGYGREAITIFKELNALSMATKGVITSQDLLAISDRFKDFDSAADAVSKLNAMLGGTSVNMLDMMKADPAEQIMMIKRAAGEASLDFDKLNIGYKRLLAEYFGGDINKAAAFFKMNMQDAQDAMNKQAASQKELVEAQTRSAALQEKLTALLDSMKIAITPIVDMMNGIFKAASGFLGMKYGPIVGLLGMILGSLKLMSLAFGRIRAAGAIALKSVAGDTETATAAMARYKAQIVEATAAMRALKAASAAPATPTAPGAGGGAAPPIVPVPPAGGGAAAGAGGMLARFSGVLTTVFLVTMLAGLIASLIGEKAGMGQAYKDPVLEARKKAEAEQVPEVKDAIAEANSGALYHVSPDGRKVQKVAKTDKDDKMKVLLTKDPRIQTLTTDSTSRELNNSLKESISQVTDAKFNQQALIMEKAVKEVATSTVVTNTTSMPTQATMVFPESALKQIARYSVDLVGDGLGTKGQA